MTLLRQKLVGYCSNALIVGSIAVLGLASPSKADIRSDNTLRNPSTITREGNEYQIRGGTRPQNGPNLFHSFSEFSVRNGHEAYFSNPRGVERIISRVTGASRSRILGTLGINGGNADLFFINPNGIIFGERAHLDVGGSFIATTADRILFNDATEFNAVNPADAPLLAIDVPIGLQFGLNPGPIRHEAFSQGLQVPRRNTLGLIGGPVRMTEGRIRVRDGRIEIGSVSNNSLINILPVARGWKFGYSDVEQFQSIHLIDDARINGSGSLIRDNVGSSHIHLQAHSIYLQERSFIFAFSLDSVADIRLIADEQVSLTGLSGILNQVEGSATGEDQNVTIRTQHLVVEDAAFISTDTFGDGQGVNLFINATETIEINTLGSLQVGVGTRTARGNGGILRLSTHQLDIHSGGEISTDTLGIGDAGTIDIRATESIELTGRVDDFASIISAQAEENSTGTGGTINLETKRLTLQEGAQIITSSRSANRGGDLTVHAAELIQLRGTAPNNRSDNFSGLVVSSEPSSTGEAGILNLTTPMLIIEEGGEISVENLGSGRRGGNAILNVEQLILQDDGQIDATAFGSGGANITLQDTQLLFMSGQSEISAQAESRANGGNLTIDATDGFVAATLDNNDLVANADEGRGGNITIETSGIFGFEERNPLSPLSDINVSSAFGADGIINITNPDLNPVEGVIELPDTLVNVEGLIDENLCRVAQGSEFIVSGRGGIAPSPHDPFQSNDLWEDWRLSPIPQVHRGQSHSESDRASILDSAHSPMNTGLDVPPQIAIESPQLTEAQGWHRTKEGRVMLVANILPHTPEAVRLNSMECYGGRQ